VREVAGVTPDDVRFLDTDEGLVAHLTLRLGSATALTDAHTQASRIEEEIRRRLPEIADVVVHTEPAA
jgi:divalent metal cation (Fe/Co/Zn/Cd) transporter